MMFSARGKSLRSLALPLIVLLAIASFRTIPAEAGSPTDQVSALVDKYELASKAICGVVAYDLRSRSKIVDVHGEALFVPASNQKILTSAFALATLGPGFQFTTSVNLVGENILVTGDGDPTIGDPYIAAQQERSVYVELDRWAQAVRQRVGANIAGDLLVCCDRFGDSFWNPSWPKAQRHRWYCAPIADLNFHNNCFGVRFAVANGVVSPQLIPGGPYIRVDSSVKKGKKHLWSLKSDAGESVVHLRGSVKGPTRSPFRVAANDPPMLLGRALAGRLAKAGVTLKGRIRKVKADEIDTDASKLLAQTKTPLALAMKQANKRSLNMAAECMFLRAGDGTWKGSAEAMMLCLTDKYGLTAEDLSVTDGGGLSHANKVSPLALTKVLGKLALMPEARCFLRSLPRSGTDGSMKSRLTRYPYKGHVIAKTGYVNGSSCLSGYILDRDYRVAVAFSVMVNRVSLGKAWVAKGLQDSICRLLVDAVNAE